MTKKLITFSFEPESLGGFACVCNGVHFGRNGAFSHCIPMTKEAFLAACKDRIKFNDLLGIDIREGWQNALKDAIDPFTTMDEGCDPELAAKAVAGLDLNIRGEAAIAEDMATLEADNEKIIATVEEEVKVEEDKKEKAIDDIVTDLVENAVEEEVKVEKPAKKSTKTSKKAKKEVKNDERRDDSAEAGSKDTGCAEGNELSADTGSTDVNA